jgi:hypothetical protein
LQGVSFCAFLFVYSFIRSFIYFRSFYLFICIAFIHSFFKLFLFFCSMIHYSFIHLVGAAVGDEEWDGGVAEEARAHSGEVRGVPEETNPIIGLD